MRRVVLVLLVLTVFLPSMAIARGQHLCGDRLVRKSCCCPPKRVKRAPSSVPTMQRECCTVTKSAPVLPPPAEQAPSSPLPVPVAIEVRTVLAPVAERVVHHTVVPRSQAPPGPGSLFSQRCALLV